MGRDAPEEPMLKNRISAEDFEKLSEEVRGHYTKGTDSQGEGYFLQTEEATKLKRSLETERGRADRALKVVKKIAPELATKLTEQNREDWDELADAEAEALSELRAMDLDEVRAALEAAKGDGKQRPDKDELQQQIRDLNVKVRDAERKISAAERDRGKAELRSQRIAAENDVLVRQRDVARALDQAKIFDPMDREVVGAIWQSKGLKVNPVGEPKDGEEQKRETFVTHDGQEIPVLEFAKDFAGTDLGKRFVKAPDHRVAGDGPEAPKPKPTKEAFEKMDPLAKLATAFENAAPAGAAGR
jgi:hypothetical protein